MKLQNVLDEIKLEKNTYLLPENLKAGTTCLGVEGTLELDGNVISMLYASVIEYFLNNYDIVLDVNGEFAYFSSIVNKRNGETLVINPNYYSLPQNVYGIKIKSYDLTTGKVEYELPSTIDMNNGTHNIYLPTTWQVGDKLDFYVNLYFTDMSTMKGIPLPLSFIFKDIELIYTPSTDDAEGIQLTGDQIMTVTSNYSIGDSITIAPLNMNNSWEIGQTMRISGVTSTSYITENDTNISIPSIYNYDSDMPTPFLVGTITSIDTENKKVTLSITELNTLYAEYLDTLSVSTTIYANKDKWLPSFSTDVANGTNSQIRFQDCSVDEIAKGRTQSRYYDSDNPGKNITRTNTYTDNVTAIRTSTDKFGTFTPDNN